MWIGPDKENTARHFGFKWLKIVKAFGVYFSYDLEEREKLNFFEKFKKVYMEIEMCISARSCFKSRRVARIYIVDSDWSKPLFDQTQDRNKPIRSDYIYPCDSFFPFVNGRCHFEKSIVISSRQRRDRGNTTNTNPKILTRTMFISCLNYGRIFISL